MSDLALALWSFPALLVLVLLRIPIALAMMIIGFVGSYIVFGSNIFTLNQLKTLTYGIFSNYSFSIIPLFLLMGQFATSGMSASLFKAAESPRSPQGRGRHVRCRCVRGLRRDLRLVAGNCRDDGAGGSAGVAPIRLPGFSGDRLFGSWGYAGNPDPAIGHSGDLRNPGRTEYRESCLSPR